MNAPLVLHALRFISRTDERVWR